MKSKFLWMLAALFCVLMAQAEPITRQQAQQLAESFLSKHTGSRRLSPVVNRRKLAPARQGQQADPTYYVFNRGQQEGFIIVSGDDRAEEVLGYCDQGEFDYAQLPLNMRSWLEHYARQIESLRQADTKAPRRVATHPAISQLMTCTWNQNYPYNMNCPNYFGQGTSVTGCVATAMAQIMYYQRSKSTDRTLAAIPAYDTSTEHPTYGHLHVDGIPEGSPIDWDHMRDSYSSSSATEREAVANLMLYCGVSVEMDYTNSSSGAYSYMVAEALKKYFGYGSSVQYTMQSYYSNDAWDELLYNELAQRRAFYLSGANAEVGHAFVCDGYDGDRHYHINWGWGGQSDGYFLLTNLTPGSQGIGGSDDGYNNGVEAIIGIEPENFTDMAIRFTDATVKKLCVAQWDADGDGNLSYGEAAAVTTLGETFKGASTIKSFNELRNFTALTSLGDDAFNGCRAMTTLTLPDGITSLGDRALNGCRALKQLVLPSGVNHLGDSALTDCRALTELTLPEGITSLGTGTLEGCLGLTELELPEGLTRLGNRALAKCTKLQTLQVHASTPAAIEMGTEVFDGMKLTTATLIVQQGGKKLFAEADQWKEFATIKERRTEPQPTFCPLQTGRKLLLFNTEAQQFLTQGEAWGTQAIVGSSAIRIQLKRDDTMPEGQYYIYSDDTGGGHFLFRTAKDDNVGVGVKAVFVDGYQDERAIWTIQAVGENLYTIQPPTGSSDYVDGLYWGVQPSHQSNVASPTSGIYYDIPYAGNEQACQWAFIDYEQTFGIYLASQELENLLNMAISKNLNVTREQAVFDDMESSLDNIVWAQRNLRKKLKLINFEDELVRDICISNFDLDGDEEMSQTEGTMATNLGYCFYNKNIKSFDELSYFTNLTELYGNSFESCSQLQRITLPGSLSRMYYRVFYGCSALQEITLPEHIGYIGQNCFSGCSSLKVVRVANPEPASIQIDATAFADMDVKAATLYVPFGAKEKYAEAAVWKEFGQILEYRASVQPVPTPLAENTLVYIYNVAERRYLNKGEAWGTQAVVGLKGMKYQVKHDATMPEGQYYLYSTETGKDGKVLFRTDSDQKVGTGVKACFVDGTLSERAYWTIEAVGDNLYTIQVPGAEDEYLGVQTDHESNNYPTYGAYWDFSYAETPAPCQWAFITVDDYNAASKVNQLAATLKGYLEQADEQGIDAADEQAVYDNPKATADELQAAISSIKQKFGYIDFADSYAKSLCVEAYDTDEDNEISYTEAAAVSDIGETFRGVTGMKSFEELRYFTSLTEIPENAFRGCSGLTSIYLPEGITQIGKAAFTSCTALKYMAVLPTKALPTCGTNSSLSRSVVIFAPASMKENYEADEYWSRFTTKLYTGIPVITAQNDTTVYGRALTKYTYEVTGAPINGEPTLACEATVTTPAGDHEISVLPGAATNHNLVCQPGTLTITRAPLVITAKSCTRLMFEENPVFELTYRTFKNKETAEVLLKQPIVECDATPDSPAGEYEIRVYGAEAQNYEITYVNGTLTVEVPVGIQAPVADKDFTGQPIYDMQGRQVSAGEKRLSDLPRGIYIVGGKKLKIEN